MCFAYEIVMVLILLATVLSLLTNNRRGKFRIKYQKKLHAKLFFPQKMIIFYLNFVFPFDSAY